jgi:uroporphyrinogen-III synthase
MRLMVTRPLREAEATRHRLEALGHVVLVEPMLTILARAVALPEGPFDAVVVTSGNAVAGLTERPGFSDLTQLQLLAVGRRTAEAARRAGFSEVASAGRDVAALVAQIAQAWDGPRRILYLAGSDRSSDLAEALSPLGHAVQVVEVYDAVKSTCFSDRASSALREGSIEAVLHYSARTAEAFVSCCQGVVEVSAARPRHLCLSAKVADVLTAAGAATVEVAARPDEDALLARLAL